MRHRHTTAAALLWGAIACQPQGPSSPHGNIGPDGEPLRSAFNADTGRVRVIMLVAPT